MDGLREATVAAAEFFTAPHRRRIAEAYLRHRGIDPAALGSEWVIGYAPPGWTTLTDELQATTSPEVLLEAGLTRLSRRGTLIDTFRERVMFGIHDADGRIAGFIGRDISSFTDVPKYLNTHRNASFNKGETLYGLHEGAHRKQPVVVEGPTDVLAIASRSHDLLPVAACGTAFTARHAALLRRSVGHPQVVVALDNDTAGIRATLDVGGRLRAAGLDVLVADMPVDFDPASYLRSGHDLDAFAASRAMPLVDVELAESMRVPEPTAEARVGALHRAVGVLAASHPNDIAERVGRIASELSLESSAVTRELIAAIAP